MPSPSDTPSAVLPGLALACRSPMGGRHLRGGEVVRSPALTASAVSGRVAEPDPHHPAASAEPPTTSRGLRAAARSCASSAPRRVAATVEDGLSATAGHPRLWGRRRRRQREPGSLRSDAAGYIRRPRRSRPGATKDPLGNRGAGDLTTNTTHTTPLARMASSRILLALPWAEGLEVAPDGSVL